MIDWIIRVLLGIARGLEKYSIPMWKSVYIVAVGSPDGKWVDPCDSILGYTTDRKVAHRVQSDRPGSAYVYQISRLEDLYRFQSKKGRVK